MSSALVASVTRMPPSSQASISASGEQNMLSAGNLPAMRELEAALEHQRTGLQEQLTELQHRLAETNAALSSIRDKISAVTAEAKRTVAAAAAALPPSANATATATASPAATGNNAMAMATGVLGQRPAPTNTSVGISAPMADAEDRQRLIEKNRRAIEAAIPSLPKRCCLVVSFHDAKLGKKVGYIELFNEGIPKTVGDLKKSLLTTSSFVGQLSVFEITKVVFSGNPVIDTFTLDFDRLFKSAQPTQRLNKKEDPSHLRGSDYSINEDSLSNPQGVSFPDFLLYEATVVVIFS